MSDSDMIPPEHGNSTFYHEERRRVWLMWCLREREKGRTEATAVREHKLRLACGHNWTFYSVPVSITGAHFTTCFLSLPSKTKLHEGYLIRLLPTGGAPRFVMINTHMTDKQIYFRSVDLLWESVNETTFVPLCKVFVTHTEHHRQRTMSDFKAASPGVWKQKLWYCGKNRETHHSIDIIRSYQTSIVQPFIIRRSRFFQNNITLFYTN